MEAKRKTVATQQKVRHARDPNKFELSQLFSDRRLVFNRERQHCDRLASLLRFRLVNELNQVEVVHIPSAVMSRPNAHAVEGSGDRLTKGRASQRRNAHAERRPSREWHSNPNHKTKKTPTSVKYQR